MSVTARQVLDALKHRYATTESSDSNIASEEVAVFVRTLANEAPSSDGSILDTLSSLKPDWVLSAQDRAVLASVRDSLTMIFNLIDLEPAVELHIRSISPIIAAELIENPALPLDSPKNSILSILDVLLDATIGWTDDQGRAGENLLKHITETVASLKSGQADYESLETELNAFLGKEAARIKKLEDRLAASESGKLRSQKSRSIAAEMINAASSGQKLTTSIIHFLKGPWYESMQLLALNSGVDGDDWIRATKLTETIIWTYQPTSEEAAKANAEKQRLYRIIEHLPGEIRELLLAFEHNSDDLDAAIGDIEEDHVLMVSGQELEYVDYEPIETGEESSSKKPAISRILLRKVNSLEPGLWFIFEEGEKRARIKLVLKLKDVRQMLFTNRNGMKALDKSFDEIAYLMSSSVLKVLNHNAVFTSTFSTFYQGLIEEYERKQKLAEQADQVEAEKESEKQKALLEAAASARAQQEELLKKKEDEKQVRLERARAEATRAENKNRLVEITALVEKLAVGAWLKLPAADGTLEECKLAVKIAAADKLIFVSRAGVKIGEYTNEQLTTLLVAGDGEISDAGVEFEDTLAQVVTKLRADREKSYDDLTGS